jgi:hypothetical protein
LTNRVIHGIILNVLLKVQLVLLSPLVIY